MNTPIYQHDPKPKDRGHTIVPGVVTRDGRTIYPTGDEWLLAFAIHGCDWAVLALEARIWKIRFARRCDDAIRKALGGRIPLPIVRA